MKQLTFVQAEAITQLKQEERVKWVAKGMHVLRQHQHGKRKWKPVLADWQIEEAKRQKAAYRVYLQDSAHILRRRMPVSIRKDRRISGIEES
jgi:pyruvate-formate lyase-activating enzyme